jgi:hypothetical protein
MFSVAEHWNPKQKLLKSIIQKEDRFDESINIILDLHSMVHSQNVYNNGTYSLEDELWFGLDKKAFITKPTPKDTTIAWNIWHITRIEDLTVNVLIADEVQEFINGKWSSKLNVKISDTGNAMSDIEIVDFSSAVNMNELREYRMAVGRRTRDVIKNLKSADFKKKVQAQRLKRILDEGGILGAEGSKWLLDFWGRKNIGGLILMPITRHQVVHLNDSLNIKKKCSKM